MKIQLPLFVDKTILPTNKYHVSFSEISTAAGTDGCTWRHKLKYIDGHEEPDTEHTTYGRTLHSALEDWSLNRLLPSFNWEDRTVQCMEDVKNIFEQINFKPSEKELQTDWISPIYDIFEIIPSWMEENFPKWEVFAAELQLFEPIENHKNKWFKGFIDLVIKVPKQPRKGSKKSVSGYTFWVLDWKTTSWGWDKTKKQDKYKKMQLALYKHYLSEKLDIPFDDIKCGFILLKRTAKKNKLELVEVSVGEKFRTETLDWVSNSVGMLEKRLWVKNRNACRFCTFQGTSLCT